MSFTTPENKFPADGNGSTKAFLFDAPINAIADVAWWLTNDTTKVETLQANPADYTVSGTFPAATLTADFVVAPPTGTTVTGVGITPFTQPKDFDNFQGTPGESLEATYDTATMQTRRNAETLERALKLPVTDTVKDPEIPNLKGNAGKTLAVTDAETDFKFIAPGTPGVDSVGTFELIDRSVTTIKIALKAVTAAETALKTMTAAQIALATLTLAEMTQATLDNLRVEEVDMQCSDTTSPLSVDTGVNQKFFLRNFTLTGDRVVATVATAGTTSVITIDINKDGATILSTKIAIAAGDKSSASKASTGSVTLTGGASGTVDGVLVNSVEIMSGAEAFDTSLTVTAANVAANINANVSSPDYKATSSGAVITIVAVTLGTGPDGFTVVSSSTTITTSDVNMAGGFDSVAVVNALDVFIPAGSEISVDIDAVDSGGTGAGLIVYLIGKRDA